MDFWEWGLYNVPMKRGDADDCRIHGIRVAGGGGYDGSAQMQSSEPAGAAGTGYRKVLCICRGGSKLGSFLFLNDAFWPTFLLFPFYLLGASGAGDVKLISALSAMTGGYRIRDLILISFLIGAILALIRLIKERHLFFRSGRVLAHLVHCILSRKISKYEPCKESELYVPFTVCIWIAYFLLNFWR